MHLIPKYTCWWRRLMVAAAFVMCSCYTLFAAGKKEGVTTEGKEFFVVFFENGKNKEEKDISLDLYFSTRQAEAKVTIAGTSKTVTVKKGEIGTINVNKLNAYVRVADINKTQKKGLIVTSTEPICLYALNVAPASTDATCVLPVEALDKDYILQSYDANRSGNNNAFAGMFAVMATEDNTTIAITPSIELQSHAANTTFQISLNRGQTYFCKAKGETNKSICGTTIKATKPVAVFHGNNSCTVPKDIGDYDHIYEQAVPNIMQGDTFALVKISEAFDMVRFTAMYDNTEVYINGSKMSTLSALGTYEYKLEQKECFVTCSKPVVCNSFLCGRDNNTNPDLSDPSMVVNIPIEQSIDTSTFVTTTSENSVIEEYYVNVVTLDGDKGKLKLDGSAIGASQFKKFSSNPKYVYCTCELTKGAHTITGGGGRFLATIFGIGVAESYAYTAGCSAKILYDTVRVETNDTICEKELPYTKWRNKTIEKEGTFADTTKDCEIDTIFTLNLKVYKEGKEDVFDTICECKLPYKWNNKTFTEAGDYPFYTMTIHGCDSLVVLHLTVNGCDTIDTVAIVCNTSLPYLWHGKMAKDGDTIVLTNKVGCDSIVTLRLVSDAEPTIYKVDTTICDTLLPYTWRGKVFTTAETHRDTLYNKQGCDSVYRYYQLDTVHCYPVPCIDTLVYKKWEDVIFCANGSHNIVAFQWYRNSELMTGETAQYYYHEGGFDGAEYFVEITLADGTKHRTCPQSFAVTPRSADTYVYVQTVVKRGGVMQIEMSDNQAMVTIYSVVGQPVVQTMVYGNQVELPIDVPEGIYVMQLVGDNVKSNTKIKVE